MATPEVVRPPVPHGGWNPSLAFKSASAPARRAKKVSWAPEEELTQVRLFAASDSPHAAAERSRSDQLAVQVEAAIKTAAALPKKHRGSGGKPRNLSRQALEEVRPSVGWTSPPKVTLNPEWHVPAGDESAERAVQDSQNRGTLEAIYLHGSAIPDSPAEPEDAKAPPRPDAQIPEIPLNPLDDEAVLMEEDIPKPFSGVQAPATPAASTPPVSAPSTQVSHPPPPPQHPPPQNVNAAPQAALAAALGTSQASLAALPPLDNRALLDLLNNPAILQLGGQGADPNQALGQLVNILGGFGQNLMQPNGSAPPHSAPRPPLPPLPAQPPPRQVTAPLPRVPPPRPPPGPPPLPAGRPPLPQGPMTSLLTAVRPPPPSYPAPRPPPGWPPQNRPRFEAPRPANSAPGFPFAPPQRPLQPRGEWRPPNGALRGPPPQPENASPSFRGVPAENWGAKNGIRGMRPVGRPENMRDRKLCLYFNTAQGCHKGENCTFFHARQAGFVGNAQQTMPPGKRTKLDGNPSYYTQP